MDGNETSSLDLDSDAIATIIGEDKDDFAGWGLDGGGDFDGDGTADVIIGAHNAETATTLTNSGMVYVFRGYQWTNSPRVRMLRFGRANKRTFGRDVAFIGDLDDDGDEELAMAAPYYNATLIFGSFRSDGGTTFSGI